MKSKRIAKLLAAAVSVLLIVVAIVCVTIFAGEGDPATIKRVNISYDGAVSIVYDVAINKDGVEPVLLVWEDTEGEKTAENATYVVGDYGIYQYGDDYVGTKFDGVYFRSRGFAPKDLRKPISAAVAVYDTEAGAYVFNSEEIATLSVFDYVMKRFENTTASADQKALYTSLLNYGGAVQAVLYEGSINKGESVETATEKAGLAYGYVDAYVGVKLDQTALVAGETKLTEGDVTYYRHGEDISFAAPTTYMGRTFAGITDADGKLITSSDGESTYSRYCVITDKAPGVQTFTASYARATGTAVTYENELANLTVSNLGTKGSVTDLENGGILFKKTAREELSQTVYVPANYSSNGLGDDYFLVAEADLSVKEIFEGSDNTFIFIAVDAGAYSYRVNVSKVGSNKIKFATSSEAGRYTPRIILAESDNSVIEAKYSTNMSNTLNDGFADKTIAIDDLKNVRIEIHPENEKLVDYKYIVSIDEDGKTDTTDDRTETVRTVRVLAPEVRLYVNGEYWGSAYHGGYYSQNSKLSEGGFRYDVHPTDATKDDFATPYQIARDEGTTPTLSTLNFTFFYGGAAAIEIANAHFGLYDLSDTYYNAISDTQTYGNYDYTNNNHIVAGRLTSTSQVASLYKATTGSYYLDAADAGEGAIEYKVTWNPQVWGNVTESGDGYFITKSTTIVSVLDADGNDLLANGGTFEGLKAGDVIPRSWPVYNEVKPDWGGSNTSLVTKKADTRYGIEYTGDTFVWETDFIYETTDVSNNHVEGRVVSNGQKIFEFLLHVASNGNITIQERTTTDDTTGITGANTEKSKALIGKLGERINLRFEAVINSYTDNSKNYVNIYANDVLVLVGDTFNSNLVSESTGIDQVQFYLPNTPRNVIITLENSNAVRYVEIPETDNTVNYDWNAESIVDAYPEITGSGAVKLDKTKADVGNSNYWLHTDTFDGKNVLNFGKAEYDSEGHFYFAVPNKAVEYERVLFSTKLYIVPGTTFNNGDWMRITFNENANNSPIVNQLVISPSTVALDSETNVTKWSLGNSNVNSTKAYIYEGEWADLVIDYNSSTGKVDVYLNGIMVWNQVSHNQSGTDANYVSVQMRGGNLRNSNVLLSDTKIGYTNVDPTVSATWDYDGTETGIALAGSAPTVSLKNEDGRTYADYSFSSGASGEWALIFPVENLGELTAGKKIVFTTNVKIGPIVPTDAYATSSSPWFMYAGITDNNSATTADNDHLLTTWKYWKSTDAVTTGAADSEKLLPYNEWFNLTVVTYLTGTQDKNGYDYVTMEFYVNGYLLQTDKITNYSSKASGPQINDDVAAFKLKFKGAGNFKSFSISFDSTSFEMYE